MAARTWSTARTPHIEVVTDAGPDVAARVATRLEELRSALAQLLPPLVVDAAPVQVIVFRDATLAGAYAPTWRGLQDDVAGFYHGGADRRRLLFVDDQGRTPSVAQHEYLHSLLDVAYPEVPLWLNEGLAEYVSTFTTQDGHAKVGDALRPHLEWLATHELMPLHQLFTIDQASSDYHEGDRRGTFYAESWLLVHMLLSGSESDLEKLGRVLVEGRDGARFETVFTREFGDEFSLRDQLTGTLRSGRLVAREWMIDAPTGASAPRVRTRTPAADVLGSLALELLARPVPQREDAEEHLRKALALDARAPDALAGMGWLELMRAHPTEARDWFDKALAVTPISVTAVRVIASQLLLDVGQRSDAAERRLQVTYVRAALERALAASPDDPELLSLLARSWAVWYGSDPEPGWAPAVRAARALPGRADVQLDLLALAALTGRETEAQRVYDQRFRDSDSPEQRRSAQRAWLAGDVFQANRSLLRGDSTAAAARLEAARARVADDPELSRMAERYVAELQRVSRATAATDQENQAISEYNRGVQAANARRYTDAEAAFRRAADRSARPEFQAKALRLATRMRQQQDGERAFALARSGQVGEAIAIFEAMDRSSMSAEDRKWLDTNLARLRAQKH